jgi:hypothetical protein
MNSFFLGNINGSKALISKLSILIVFFVMRSNRFLFVVFLCFFVLNLSANRELNALCGIVEATMPLINQERQKWGLKNLEFKGISTKEELDMCTWQYTLGLPPSLCTSQKLFDDLQIYIGMNAYNSILIYYDGGYYYVSLVRDVKKLAEDQDAFEAEVVRLVNVERTKRGMNPLIMHRDLQFTAGVKAKEFVVYDYYDHYSPVSGEPEDLVKSHNDAFYFVGENIAQGQITPEEVVFDWMNSPGHRANILNPKFEYIGVGYYQDNWVQQFAKMK